MSCGRPVIGTDGGGTKEYIVHGQSGLIVPTKNADAIAESLIQLLKDEDERKRLGLNARNRVLEVFDRVEIAKCTTALYQKAAESMKERQKTGLYEGDAQKAIYDADEILYQFDRMIGDLVLRHSFRAYLESIFKLMLKRPRLVGAKLVVALLDATGLGTGKTAQRLKEQIRDKERIKLMLAKPGVHQETVDKRQNSLSRQ